VLVDLYAGVRSDREHRIVSGDAELRRWHVCTCRGLSELPGGLRDGHHGVSDRVRRWHL